MKNKYTIVPATMDHALELAPRLRAADLAEVKAASGRSASSALLLSVVRSHLAYAAIDSDGVIALWGVAAPSILSPIGSPWLLGSERLVTKYRRAVGRVSRNFIEEIRPQFKQLENYVDARNLVSIRWLKWCGFIIEPAAPYGHARLPFHHFVMFGGN